MSEDVAAMIQETFQNKVRLCVKNQGKDAAEYIYELSEKQIGIYQKAGLDRRLLEHKDVWEVNLVGQNDEISA